MVCLQGVFNQTGIVTCAFQEFNVLATMKVYYLGVLDEHKLLMINFANVIDVYALWYVKLFYGKSHPLQEIKP